MGSYRNFLVLFVWTLQVVGTFQQTDPIPQCVGRLDVIFAVDGSASVGQTNFRRQVAALTNLIGQLEHEPGLIHAGAILFNSSTQTIRLQSDLDQLAEAINNWAFPSGGTNTGQAINDARDIFALDARGGTVPKLLFLITGDASDDKALSLEQAEMARSEGIAIFVVGISDLVDEHELIGIAGSSQRPPADCDLGTTDVWLVVDVSSNARRLSQTDFGRLKKSLQQFVNIIEDDSFNNERVRMGFISYSDTAHVGATTTTSNSVTNTVVAINNIPNGIASSGSNLRSALMEITEEAQEGNYRSYVVIITPVVQDPSQIANLQSQKDRLERLGYMVVMMVIVDDASNFNPEAYQQLASSLHYFFQTETYTELQVSLFELAKSALCGGPKPGKLPGLCAESGRDVKNIVFVPHPFHCESYIQCYYRKDDDFDLSVTRRCPTGFFWNKEDQKCQVPGNFQCAVDRCMHKCDISAIPGNCRGYYKCVDGKSVAQCCPENQLFKFGVGCVDDKDHTCSDHCDWDQVTCVDVDCRSIPNWKNHGSYELSGFIENPFNTLFSASCRGMEFDAATCDCSVQKGHECHEDITFNFAEPNMAKKIYSNSMKGIKVSEVTLGATGLIFGAGSNVHVMSTDKNGNEPLTLKFSFREAQGSLVREQATIWMLSGTNCPGRDRGRLMARASSEYVGFYVSIPGVGSAHVDVPLAGFDPNEFKEATLVYSGDLMTATIKGKYQQHIESVKAPKGAAFPCGFEFGSTEDYDGFTGIIEYISVYSCTPPRLY